MGWFHYTREAAHKATHHSSGVGGFELGRDRCVLVSTEETSCDVIKADVLLGHKLWHKGLLVLIPQSAVKRRSSSMCSSNNRLGGVT